MSKISSDEAKGYATILIVVFAIVLVAIIAGKLFKGFGSIAELLGLKDDKEDKRKQAEQAATVNQAAKDVKLKIEQGQKPSYSDTTYKTAAQTIQEATRYSSLSDKPEIALNTILTYTPKPIDWFKLVEAFGSRPHYFIGLERDARTLPELVNNELNNTQKKRMGAVFKKRGIPFLPSLS